MGLLATRLLTYGVIRRSLFRISTRGSRLVSGQTSFVARLETAMEGRLSKEEQPWLSSPGSVLKLLLTVRLISALTMHITDGDETFNYWEPVS